MPSNYKKQPQEKWAPRRAGENRWPDWKLAEVLARYRKGGVTQASMAREFGISQERMRQVIKKAEMNADKKTPGDKLNGR